MSASVVAEKPGGAGPLDEERRPRRGRLAVNVAANLASYAVGLVIGIWYVPYLIHHVGTVGYGLIPLITTMTNYMGIVTLGLNAAVGRFITLAAEQGDHPRANRVFNTSLFGSVLLVLVLMPPALWAALNVERLLRVPPAYVTQARWLALATVAAFLLNQIKTAFDVSTFCRNRFDLRNLVSIGESLTRVAVVVTFFSLAPPQLWQVGTAIVASGVFSFLGAVYFWRRLMPELRIHLGGFDLRTLRELVGMAGWNVLNQIGTILFLGVDLLVINRLFGARTGGHYAAVLQWSALLRGLASAFAGAFIPTIIAFYARRDLEGLVHYARRSVKLTGLAMALPIGLVCGSSRSLLQAWLGPDFASLAPLLSLMTAHLAINLGYLPLHGINTATNQVRLPGIVQLAMGAANLALALLLAGPARWGVYGVAGAGAIVLTFKNTVFTPIYAAHVLKLPWNTFLKGSLPSVTAAVATAGLTWLVLTRIPVGHLSHLAVVWMGLSAVYVVAVYFGLLSAKEREEIRRANPLARKTRVPA